MTVDLSKRYRGAILGMATGDALGTTIEFRARGTFKPMTTIIGGGPFDLNKGDWTDDTSMGLCLAESLLKCKEFNASHQMDTYVQWWAHGHNSSRPDKGAFDMGTTVRGALRLWKTRKTMYPDGSADPFCGDTDPLTAGNGCIMRLAPIPLYYHNQGADAVISYSAQSSRTTHGARTCLDSSAVLGYAIHLALCGMSKYELLDLVRETFDSPETNPQVRAVTDGSYRTENERFIKGTGFVVECLEAALWAFWNTDTFEAGALKAVNLGDDADTTGAVYGQLAGAYYGEDGIPKHWRDCLARKSLLDKTADRLFKECLP
jgi:ADP-ribosyl-[dinitrogen reductase] hydrolase